MARSKTQNSEKKFSKSENHQKFFSQNQKKIGKSDLLKTTTRFIKILASIAIVNRYSLTCVFYNSQEKSKIE